MATFGWLKQAAYDRLGISSPGTADTAMVERWVNDSCAEVCERHTESYFKNPDSNAWWWLESSTPFVMDTSLTYTLQGANVAGVTDIGYVIRMYDPFGVPLEIIHSNAFEDLYAGDATTGSPRVATITGLVQIDTSARPNVTVAIWPAPTTTTTGSLSYLRAWTNIPPAADWVIPWIPANLHVEINDLVLARADRWQDSEMAPQMEQRAQGSLGLSSGV